MVDNFRALALKWAEYQSTPDIANRYYGLLAALQQKLKITKSGREQLIELLDDDELPVRFLAAVHCLEIHPGRATRALTTIENDPDEPVYRIAAASALRAYRNGTLSEDW